MKRIEKDQIKVGDLVRVDTSGGRVFEVVWTRDWPLDGVTYWLLEDRDEMNRGRRVWADDLRPGDRVRFERHQVVAVTGAMASEFEWDEGDVGNVWSDGDLYLLTQPEADVPLEDGRVEALERGLQQVDETIQSQAAWMRRVDERLRRMDQTPVRAPGAVAVAPEALTRLREAYQRADASVSWDMEDVRGMLTAVGAFLDGVGR